MFKLSLILLFLSIPLLDSSMHFGIPLWVYGSLGATLLYAFTLIFLIEKRWNHLKESHE